MDIDPKISNLSIHEAAKIGDLNRVKFLIEHEGISVNARESTFGKLTVLHYAARAGQEKVVTFLLSQNASIDERTITKTTPLTCAIIAGHTDVTRCLLKHGADPNDTIRKQKSLGNNIHIAAEKGFTDIINLLLQYGADPNCQRNPAHRTALHLAVKNMHPQAILCLYKHTNTQLKDKYEDIPIKILIRLLWSDLEYQAKSGPVFQCLYAFLLAGTKITEDLVRQVISDLLLRCLPQIMQTIQEAETYIGTVQNKLAYLGPEVSTDVILNSKRGIHEVLDQEKQLKKNGVYDLPTTKRFLLAPPNARKEFLFYQKWLNPRKLKGDSLSNCPTETLQDISRELLPDLPNISVKDFKYCAEQEQDAYTRLGMR